MNGSKQKMVKEDYNNIPVHYCKQCGSLRIMGTSGVVGDYCDTCGSTDIDITIIDTWLELQKTVYNND